MDIETTTETTETPAPVDAETRAAPMTVERREIVALEEQCRALATDRDVWKKRALTAERENVSNEVRALVGVKITPAELDDALEEAVENLPRFRRRMAARPDLHLLGGSVLPPDRLEKRDVDGASRLHDEFERSMAEARRSAEAQIAAAQASKPEVRPFGWGAHPKRGA